MGPPNTNSNHQRDGRQRHAAGVGSMVPWSICSSLSTTTAATKAPPGSGITYVQDTAESQGRRITSCILLQRDVSVCTSRLCTPARTCAPRQLPPGFPLLVGASNAIEIQWLRLGSWRALSTGSLDSSKGWVWLIPPPGPCLHTKTVGTTELAY